MQETEQQALQDAHDELDRILTAISIEVGLDSARHAALTLRATAKDGEIDGHDYISRPENYEYDEREYHCAIGAIATSLGWQGDVGDTPNDEVPGWTQSDYPPYMTALEAFLYPVTPSSSADWVDRSDRLDALIEWCDSWLSRTAVS